jgi:hypothetical protein
MWNEICPTAGGPVQRPKPNEAQEPPSALRGLARLAATPAFAVTFAAFLILFHYDLRRRRDPDQSGRRRAKLKAKMNAKALARLDFQAARAQTVRRAASADGAALTVHGRP